VWARSLGGEAAVKLLTKFSLLDAAIEFATENDAFDFAFELSRFSDASTLASVHYKHAMHLEDQGQFKEAESEFLAAGKAKEAILMYVHNENWSEALSVAEKHDPSIIGEVLIGQAKVSFDKKDYVKAESLLLRAQRPDLAISMYKSASMWNEAVKFAREYLPAKLAEIKDEHDQFVNGQAAGGKDEILASARNLEVFTFI
jgi:intraflagellar transport protein 172